MPAREDVIEYLIPVKPDCPPLSLPARHNASEARKKSEFPAHKRHPMKRLNFEWGLGDGCQVLLQAWIVVLLMVRDKGRDQTAFSGSTQLISNQ